MKKSLPGHTAAALYTRVLSTMLFITASVGCASSPADSRQGSTPPGFSAGGAPSNSLSRSGAHLALPQNWKFLPPKNISDYTYSDADPTESVSAKTPRPPVELFRFSSPDGEVLGVCIYLGDYFSGAHNPVEAAFLYSNALGPGGPNGADRHIGYPGEKKYYIREVTPLVDTTEEKSLLMQGRSRDETSRFLSLLIEKPSGFYLLETCASTDKMIDTATEIQTLLESFTLTSPYREARHTGFLGMDFLAADGSWRWAGDKEEGFLLRGEVGDYEAEASISVGSKGEDNRPRSPGSETFTEFYTVNHIPRNIQVDVYPEDERGGMLRFELRRYYIEIYFPGLRSAEKVRSAETLRRLSRHESIAHLIGDHLRWDLSGETP